VIKLLNVEGHSLYPYIKDGQTIICIKVFKFSRIRIGDLVVFSKKPYGLMIKRVERVDKGRFFVQGTDPMSIDSRNFGLIERADIHYKKI
jgi:phage repressor protein C with HTH and peptisase S24 domain